MIPDHLGGTNKWNEPIATHFGPLKITKCLENGLFWDRRSVKNGSKMGFSKHNFGLFEVQRQVVSAHREPMLSNLAALKAERALKMGPQMAQKRVKTIMFQK